MTLNGDASFKADSVCSSIPEKEEAMANFTFNWFGSFIILLNLILSIVIRTTKICTARGTEISGCAI